MVHPTNTSFHRRNGSVKAERRSSTAEIVKNRRTFHRCYRLLDDHAHAVHWQGMARLSFLQRHIHLPPNPKECNDVTHMAAQLRQSIIVIHDPMSLGRARRSKGLKSCSCDDESMIASEKNACSTADPFGQTPSSRARRTFDHQYISKCRNSVCGSARLREDNIISSNALVKLQVIL
jgi:hypothetical protein